MKNNLRSSDVPDIKLERYLLGELPSKEMSSLKEAVDLDNELQQRIDQLIQSNQQILKEHSPETFGHLIRIRAKEDSPRWKVEFPRWLVPIFTGCFAIMALHYLPDILLDQNPTTDSRLISSDNRIKGLEPTLRLFRKAESGSEILNDRDKVKQGDLIRLGYQAADALYGAIISVDGRGAVTQHLPRRGHLSSQLKTGETILLDFSYELDDAPYWERFYFITSQNPFSLEPVLEAAVQFDSTASISSRESLKIDASLKQFVISLQKEAP